MKKYVENMKEYEEICGKFEEICEKYGIPLLHTLGRRKIPSFPPI